MYETAFGLEQVADDIRQSGHRPEQVLMVHLVVVDDYWRGRGRGLGPALVRQAARRLGCRFVAVQPEAFPTRVEAGRCVPARSEPVRSREALEQVRGAWQRAGFRPLTATTWFNCPDDVMAPYLASVDLLDRASGYLGTSDTDRWLTERHEGWLGEKPRLRAPRRPRGASGG